MAEARGKGWVVIDRFRDALYTPTEVARYLDVPSRTMGGRVDPRPGSTQQSIVTAGPVRVRGEARVPFIGLAEAYVLRAMRQAQLPMQRIRPALEKLAHDEHLRHALASERLFTDGAELLIDMAAGDKAATDAVAELVVVRSGQRVLPEVVRDYLRRVTFSSGYAQVVPLPVFGDDTVVVDPSRGFGQPIFATSGARVEDAIDLFKAGVDVHDVADEFAISVEVLQQALRGRLSLAA